MPKGKPGRVYLTLTCQQCNEKFTVEYAERNRKFCSRGCYWNSLCKESITQLSKAERGYLAGIIDGEGSICLSKTSGKTRTVHPVIYISSSSKELIDWLERKISVRIYRSTHDDKRGAKYKRMYNIQIFGLKNVGNLLKQIKPYLVIKTKQAELALNYIDRRLARGSKKYNNEDFYYHNKMKELNNPIHKPKIIQERMI